MKPVDLIGCGALNLDLIYRLPRTFPLWDELGPPGTEQLMDASVRKAVDEALAHVDPVRAGGGQAANTVHALARLGYGAAMVGRVGADEDGAVPARRAGPGRRPPGAPRGRHRPRLRAARRGRRAPQPRLAGGQRRVRGRRPAQARCRAPASPSSRSFVGDEPLEAQLALLERLPADVEVAFDPGEIYARKGVKRFLPILQRCAYLFSTETELEMLCGLSLPESLDFLLNAGVGLVIVKMGGRGARLVGRRVDLYVPPLPAEVVDVTGAGDLFAAGFLAAMIEQAGLESAGRLAAWAAQPRHLRPRPQRLPGRGRLARAPRRGARRGRGRRPARERLVRVGWLSTGRDQAASNLLSDVVARAQQDDVPLEIGAVFCDRERGEAPESDRFLDLVDRLGIPAVTLSSRASWAEAQKLGVSRAAWRNEYHRGVAELLIPYRLGVLVLAGYMLIASPALCRRFAILNLHPALPGGPKGMWQQVIWELLENEADETGAMIHLATAQLDRGPVVSYFRFPLRGPDWDPLWEQFRAKRKTMSVEEIAAAEGEDEPLFAEIRRRGEVREIPLLYQTLRQFAEGKLNTANGCVFAESARLPLDLTEQVDAEVEGR